MANIRYDEPSLHICGKDYTNEMDPFRALPPVWFVDHEMIVVVGEFITENEFDDPIPTYICMSLDATGISMIDSDPVLLLDKFELSVERALVDEVGGIHYGKTPSDVQLADITQDVFLETLHYDWDENTSAVRNIRASTVKLFKSTSPYYDEAVSGRVFLTI
jgi:hypothetical protein